MKKIILLTMALGTATWAQAQATAPAAAATTPKKVLEKPYKPTENAAKKLAELSALAKKQNKKILVQGGGNWCVWCLRLNDYIKSNPELKRKIDAKYITYHLNFSPENENKAIFAKYGDPGKKYGYPVWLILDKNLKLVKTQETGSLEKGTSYDDAKIAEVLGL